MLPVFSAFRYLSSLYSHIYLVTVHYIAFIHLFLMFRLSSFSIFGTNSHFPHNLNVLISNTMQYILLYIKWLLGSYLFWSCDPTLQFPEMISSFFSRILLPSMGSPRAPSSARNVVGNLPSYPARQMEASFTLCLYFFYGLICIS